MKITTPHYFTYRLDLAPGMTAAELECYCEVHGIRYIDPLGAVEVQEVNNLLVECIGSDRSVAWFPPTGQLGAQIQTWIEGQERALQCALSDDGELVG